MQPPSLRYAAGLAATVLAVAPLARAADTASSAMPERVVMTADQDRANTMQQLGMTSIRGGDGNNRSATNFANYDEAKANPYPHLPDPLVAKDGTRITTADQWWNKRR